MKKYILFLLNLSVFGSLHAQIELIKQPPKTLSGQGKIYALIIGISDYDNITDLNYADDDAKDFYNFLVTEANLGADSNNIKLLLNKKATSANVGKELLKLKNRMEEGSTFFIYFAGHGDANGEAQAFLLASDLPKIEDPSLYAFNGGVIHVYFLKDEIRKIIAEKKANVILVTDACRTNELAGRSEGAKTYTNKIMESNSGEIQFISCAADEKSEESKNFGQGRGIFSFFFTNGLRGLADTRPQDGKVTVRELFDYVQRSVEEATSVTDEIIISETGKTYRQSPQYCCTEKQNTTLVLVDEKVKQIAISKMATAEHEIRLASNGKRATNKAYEGNDTVLNSYYQKFYAALENQQLISPRGQSAWDYYSNIKKRAKKTDPAVFDATEDIKAALLNDAQNTINAFYSYTDQWGMSDKTKRLFYDEGVEKLRKARSLMEDNDPQSPLIKLTRQCMEVAGIFASSQPTDWKRGILIMDSAITAYPKNPLPHFLKGRLLYNLKRYDEALVSLNTSQTIAPRWNMPAIGISDVYYEQELYDSCERILLALASDSKIAYVYFKLGYFYGEIKKNFDLAVEYSKQAHYLAPQKTNIINNIGAYYEQQGLTDSAIDYYLKAFDLDSNNAFTLNNIAKSYKDAGKRNMAHEMLDRAIIADSTTAETYITLAGIYVDKMNDNGELLGSRLKYWQQAVDYSAKAIKFRPNDPYRYYSKASIEAEVDLKLSEKTIQELLKSGEPVTANHYNEVGLIYEKGQDTTKALKAFHQGIQADSNFYYTWYNIGIIYYEHYQWDSAIKYLNQAISVDESINYLRYKIEYAEDALQREYEDRIKAEEKQSWLEQVETNPEIWGLLAERYMEEWKYDSAYFLYDKIIKAEPAQSEETLGNYFNCSSSVGSAEETAALDTIGNGAQRLGSEWLTNKYIEAIYDKVDMKRLPMAEQLYLQIEQLHPDYYALSEMASKLAVLNTYTQNADKTLYWLEKAFERGYLVSNIENSYNFEFLLENKKFIKLMKKYAKKQKNLNTGEDINWR